MIAQLPESYSVLSMTLSFFGCVISHYYALWLELSCNQTQISKHILKKYNVDHFLDNEVNKAAKFVGLKTLSIFAKLVINTISHQ